ncbi:LuxR family transcriptional regulator [Plantibacter sp. MCCC 1A11337]|uniref:helix-turn-helix transcriptional regulator n=1 Tax=Plantibacter sp. MCCC 1A11337 TaxID=2736644 RepID=UPI00158173CF|nr:LuxR C-terminal-related transcriptional regulator [Plantibacter sp. MCCC 1A11337]NUJ88625.1 LuxR family transcriptional regulator [Plantibacter sp. MCCC 1A11337]
MTERTVTYPVELLDGLASVASSSLLRIAGAFREVLEPVVAHSALVIFTEDCTGRPRKKAGDPAIVEGVTIAELDAVRQRTPRGPVTTATADAGPHTDRPTSAVIAGADRPIAAWLADTGALLVLTDPQGPIDDRLIGALWEVVAAGIRQQVATAAPDYLRDSRAASSERAGAIAELTDAHATTLESILAVTRSRQTSADDARTAVTEIASAAMVELRAVSDRDRQLAEEPVARAFARLREDLRPLARFGGPEVQFIEPPVDGRALPGEVAHAGRAIVRGTVLALVEQSSVGRVRVQWDCDGSNLLIGIRDDGPGELTVDTPSVQQLGARVAALRGSLDVQATPGWGSELHVTLPLDPPPAAQTRSDSAAAALTEREWSVAELAAGGARNRAIAETLTISENTVKFHIANVLRKLGVASRVELAAALAAGR